MLEPNIAEDLAEYASLKENYYSLHELSTKLDTKRNLISVFLCALSTCTLLSAFVGFPILYGYLEFMIFNDAPHDPTIIVFLSGGITIIIIIIAFLITHYAEKIDNKNYFLDSNQINLMREILPQSLSDKIFRFCLSNNIALSRKVLKGILKEYEEVYIKSPNFIALSEKEAYEKNAFMEQKELLK